MCKFVIHNGNGSFPVTVELNRNAEEALHKLLEVNDILKTSRDIFLLSNQIGYMSHLIHEANRDSNLEPYYFTSESRESILILTDLYELFTNLKVKYLEA